MENVFRVPPNLLSNRNKRGVTLEEIAGNTKIKLGYLRAIEEGSFEKLPPGVYGISYIRQYARAVEYDETELLEYYSRAVGLHEEPPPPPPVKRRFSLFVWFSRVLN